MRVQDIFVLTQKILKGYFGVKHGTNKKNEKGLLLLFFLQVKFV